MSEPLVDEIAACFAGLAREPLDDLVDSFRLDRCVRREPLLELLRQS